MIELNLQKNNVNFTAGLTKDLSCGVRKVSTKQIEKIFAENYGVQADFLSDKKSATSNFLLLRLFQELNKKYPKIFQALPSQINVFRQKDLLEPSKSGAFCLLDSRQIFKKNGLSEMRSVFFEKNSLNLEEMDEVIEYYHNNNLISSNHFLSFYLHEWLHNIHADLIYKKFGYEGESLLGKKLYSKENSCGISKLQEFMNFKFSDSEKSFLEENYGKYSTFNPFEAFSEIITQDICESLGRDLLPKRPLFEDIKFLPNNISQIFSILRR